MATLTIPKPPINLAQVGNKFKQTSLCNGKIKVELWFETNHAVHITSKVVVANSTYEGPFTESICVFMDPSKVFDMVEAYWDTFENLRDANLVPTDAHLQGFDILLEDKLIQSWVEV